MTTEQSIYNLYLSNNPQEALKITPKKNSAKNKNANKNFLNQWTTTTTQWLKWLQDGVDTQPSTIPLLNTKYLRLDVKNNERGNVTPVVKPVNLPAVETSPPVNTTETQLQELVKTPVNVVQSGGEGELEQLKSDFMSWSASSPYQFNIGKPVDMEKNLFSQYPKIVNPQYVGMTRKAIRDWNHLRVLMPPEKSDQNKELLTNQLIKAWHGECAPYVSLYDSLEIFRIEFIEDYKRINQVLSIPQQEPVKFFNEIRQWKSTFGFVSLMRIMENLGSLFQQSILKGEQVDKLQKQISSLIEKMKGVSSRSNSRNMGVGIGNLFRELDSIYKSAEEDARRQSRGYSSYSSSVSPSQLGDSLMRILSGKATTLTQIRDYFSQLKMLWMPTLLYVWLVEMQLSFIFTILFWKSLFGVCASKTDAKQGTWNFAYSWNAKKWDERFVQWKELDITWIPSFDDETKIMEMAGHTWRDLHRYVPANESKVQFMNWWDLMEHGLVSTEPLWNQLWNWGGWIEPTQLSEPVNWQVVPTVRYWSIWANEVKTRYQQKITNNTGSVNEELVNEDRVNRLLRWGKESPANSSITTIMEWSNAVQKWKQEILSWRQRYDSSQNKKAIWDQFTQLISRVVSLQKTWWVLHDRLDMGSLDQRIYWNYWWDLQRFYIQYFYLTGTADEEQKLYQNSFRYNYDISKMIGGATAEGRYYLSTLLKDRQYSKMRRDINKLMTAPSFELMRAVDGSNDIMFKWQTQYQVWLRSLNVMTLWSPSWNFWNYWQRLFASLGYWDITKKQTNVHLFMPVRIDQKEYWIHLESLWRQLDSDAPVLSGLDKMGDGIPVFLNFSELARSMLMRKQDRRQPEGAVSTEIGRPLPEDWKRLFAVNTGVVKPWRIITFSQQGMDNGIFWLDRQVDINPKQQAMREQDIMGIARQQHPLIWVSWISRLLLGQQMSLTNQASPIDMSMRRPSPQQAQAQKRGGAGVQLWKQAFTQVMGVLEQELIRDRHLYGFGPLDTDALKLNRRNQGTWWGIDEQGDVRLTVGSKGDDSGERRWMLEQEMTGMIYNTKRKNSK